VARDE
jgi:hypothetical protein